MLKRECDNMHGFYADRFVQEAYLMNWSHITKFEKWRFYKETGTPEESKYESGYETYQGKILESNNIHDLSSDLYIHIVGSLLRKSDDKLLERFTAISSAKDQKVKAIALLKAYNFLAVARSGTYSRSSYWAAMMYGDFYNHSFLMLYTYHYLIHAEGNDEIKACGSNYKKLFTEPLIEETKQKLEDANNMLEKIMSLEYVHPEILGFYKSYAKNSKMSLVNLRSRLQNEIGDSYHFTK